MRSLPIWSDIVSSYQMNPLKINVHPEREFYLNYSMIIKILSLTIIAFIFS